MRDRNVEILAVQEAHLTDNLVCSLGDLFQNTWHLIHSPDPTTRNARGVAFLISKRSIKTEDITTKMLVPGRALMVTIPWNGDSTVTILNVYAPNIPGEAREFWRNVRDGVRFAAPQKPDIMLGDFNPVEDALDWIPSSTDDHRLTTLLRKLRSDANLIDGWRAANEATKGYTWTRDSDGTQSRIDRIYVREDMFPECSGWEIDAPPVPTDHDIVSAKISMPTAPKIGRGRWAIPTRLVKQQAFKKMVQERAMRLQHELEQLTQHTAQRNPQKLLRDFKKDIRDLARDHERRAQPMIKNRIATLTKELRETQNNPDQSEEEVRLVTVHLRRKIQTLVRLTHTNKRERTAAIDAVEGEKIGKMWSNRHKVAKPRDTIKLLTNPSMCEPTDVPAEMADIASEYHAQLQFQEHDPRDKTEKPVRQHILGLLKSRLSPTSKALLSGRTTEQQVRTAIRKTNLEKAPGPDGIPIELWRSMDDQYRDAVKRGEPESRCDIVWVLTQAFTDVEDFGMDPQAKLNKGCMTPIYKKKNPEDIANYRPITLLNTDYKTFTKALSLRLAETVLDVIHKDQAGFMQNRSIFDQVKTTKLVIDYMERSNKKGVVVALDQEKAYDKVLHPYLWAVLEKFDFPPRFIKTIKALYTGAETSVMINGELSKPFPVIRGVRQGDPLSCLLFNIAIEPLAEHIRQAPQLRGIPVPGRREYLKIKLFADDTTVFLSEEDKLDDLQSLLTDWCSVSGARFNIEKTEIIPLGNQTQRETTRVQRRTNDSDNRIPQNIRIAKEGEPVRILGAWLGNGIDQATTWAPIMEDCRKRLKRWGASKHSLEGRRLILQMQVAGVTQYLTKVQGMPTAVESDLNRMIRRFTWNNEKSDTVNQAQMFAPHKRGGKKVLDIETRNKAIQLTWLKTYLNLGEDRATWAYFADAIIATDIPPAQRVDEDPESRIMPVLQNWHTRTRKSTLPEDLKSMLKLAREYNVQVATENPTKQACGEMPLWYHAKASTAARKLYRTRVARCLRRNHRLRLVHNTTSLIGGLSVNHTAEPNCKCNTCTHMRAGPKCKHPNRCISLTVDLLDKIRPEWNLAKPTGRNEHQQTAAGSDCGINGVQVVKVIEETNLRNAITIFGEPEDRQTPHRIPQVQGPIHHRRATTVYTDGACINNGHEDAQAGSGVWYGDSDPRNISERVPHAVQSNQTGELTAILLAVSRHDPLDNLHIISDSRYAIDGLMRNLERWERRGWIDITHGDLFRETVAKIRWRRGTTSLEWTKGHSGTRGNEEADRLAGEGARKHTTPAVDAPVNQPTEPRTGARLTDLEQRDFYRILRDRRKIPTRKTAERNVAMIQEQTNDSFGFTPTTNKVWQTTGHRDFTRKTRDFLWKATQSAFKIGEYWKNIQGYQDRGVCPICDATEDMDHTLSRCKATARGTAWKLANEVWQRRHPTEIPSTMGGILGCGLAKFERNGRPDTGKNRLYRILVSETAFLIWKLRNE